MLEQERVEEARRQALERAVDMVMPAITLTKGTAGAPTRERVWDSIQFVLDHLNDPEMLAGQEDTPYQHFHATGGLILYVERRNKHWDFVQVFVPATDQLCWYHDEEKG